MKTETEKFVSSCSFAIALLSLSGLAIVGVYVYQTLKILLSLLEAFV